MLISGLKITYIVFSYIIASRIYQALVQDDDVRVPHGKAHENARAIVEDHNGLAKIMSGIKGNKF